MAEDAQKAQGNYHEHIQESGLVKQGNDNEGQIRMQLWHQLLWREGIPVRNSLADIISFYERWLGVHLFVVLTWQGQLKDLLGKTGQGDGALSGGFKTRHRPEHAPRSIRAPDQ